MLAVVLTGSIDDPKVEVVEAGAPKDSAGRLVIEVVSAGVTRTEPSWSTNWQDADGTQREGPAALGLEFAGRIRSLGSGVRGFAPGQSVMGMTDPYRGGALAEFVSAETDDLLPIPDGLSYEEASCLPLSGRTAWQALMRYGALERGQRVLIHGGAGAVGTFAIQIARWCGAYVAVTAAAKDEALCRSLGADEVSDYALGRFEDRGGDYDIVFDQIGGDILERSWAVVRRGGKLITIAGEEVPDQDRARACGVSALFFIVDRDMEDLRKLTDLVVSAAVRPIIGKRLPLASATEAFDARSNRVSGKIVVTCS